MISEQEVGRRLRWLSQMRELVIRLRKSGLEAYNAGELPYQPSYDIRSDFEYWHKVAEENGMYKTVSVEKKGESISQCQTTKL